MWATCGAADAEALVCNLEETGVDTVAGLSRRRRCGGVPAGAGRGSGIPRKSTVDRNASVLMADAAEQAGVRRFVQISSTGAGASP